MNDIINYQSTLERQTMFINWLDVVTCSQFFSIMYFAVCTIIFLSVTIASKEPIV
jgi:hypothetical protein